MTDPSASTRPRQVTLAGGMIIGGSVVVVLTVFERMAGLHSLETRALVEKFLSEPPGDGLGLDVEGVLGLLRTLSMVAAGCATAAAVLGYHVLRRHRGARIGLSVLALPLFLTGAVTGGFMSSMVAIASVMLWLQPSRDWFDGVTRPRDETRRTAVRPEWPARAPQPDDRRDAPPAAPPAYPAFGAPPVPGAHQAPWQPTGPAGPESPQSTARPEGARPTPVLVACLLTWVVSSLAVVLMVASVAVMTSTPGRVYDELLRQNPDLADQGVSREVLVEATFVLGAVVIVWSLVAIALAVLAHRGVAWARALLMASAGMAALLCLLAVALGQLVVVLPLGACVTTLALLARPDVRAWFDR